MARVRIVAALMPLVLLALTTGALGRTLVLLDRTYTPSDLAAIASFPARTPTLAGGGTTLSFGAGSQGNENLLVLNLLAAGSVPAGVTATVRITVDATPQTADNDLAAMVTDGVDVVGFLRADNTGWGGWLWEGEITPTAHVNGHYVELFNGAGFSQSYVAELSLGATTVVHGTVAATSATATADRHIDPYGALSLVIGAGDWNELYDINSIHVRITAELPSTLSVYVAERFNGDLDRIDLATGVGEAVASGLGDEIGVAVDRRGRVFVSRYGNGSVALVDPGTRTFVDVVTGTSQVHGLAPDPNQDVIYAAGTGSGEIYRIAEASPGAFTKSVVQSGLDSPIGLFLEGDLLYVTERGNQRFSVKNVATGAFTTLLTLPSGGDIIGREAGGDFVIGSGPGNCVFRVRLAASPTLTATYPVASNPYGILVDPTDNTVLVSQHGAHRVSRLDLETGALALVSSYPDTPWQLAFAVPAPASYSAAVLADAPLGCWRLGETSGTVAANLGSRGATADGTYAGGYALAQAGALADGDPSASFDGSTGYISVPGTWGGAGWAAFTIEAWVNVATTSADFEAVVSATDGAFAHLQLASSGSIGFYTDAGFIALPIVSQSPTGVWRHIALVASPGGSRVYVDGTQVGVTNTTAFTQVVPTSSLRIASGHLAGRFFSGRIDEVAIYATALGEAQIDAHLAVTGNPALWAGQAGNPKWSVPSNWYRGVPGAGIDVRLPGGAVNGAVDVAFDGMIGSLTLQPGFTGTLALERSLTITRSVSLGAAALAVSTTASRSLRAGAIGGTGGIRKTGAGELSLFGANTYSGATVVDGGTLRAGAAGAVPDASLLDVASGIFDLNHVDETIGGLGGGGEVRLGSGTLTVSPSAATTYSGAISGSGGLRKTGTGTLTLSGGNTYTGATLIEGGVLTVSGSLLGAGGDVTIASGGTLGGTGRIERRVVVASGGRLSPGNSPGVLVTGDSVWRSGGAYQWEVSDAAGAPGAAAGWDCQHIAGNLTIDATSAEPFVVSVRSLAPGGAGGDAANFDPAEARTWVIAAATRGVSGFAADRFRLDLTGFGNVHDGSFSVFRSGGAVAIRYDPGRHVTGVAAAPPRAPATLPPGGHRMRPGSSPP